MTTQAQPGMRSDQRRLHAYHDGELGRLARWLFERRLARSAELRTELQALEALGHWARELDETSGATADLWDAIALRLPAEDARRREGAGDALSAPARASWVRPFAAVATAVAILIAVAIGVLSRDTAPVGVVRWMDTGTRSVMVLQEDADTTIIWVLDDAVPGDVSMGGTRDVV